MLFEVLEIVGFGWDRPGVYPTFIINNLQWLYQFFWFSVYYVEYVKQKIVIQYLERPLTLLLFIMGVETIVSFSKRKGIFG